jgi:hypothetical protein
MLITVWKIFSIYLNMLIMLRNVFLWKGLFIWSKKNIPITLLIKPMNKTKSILEEIWRSWLIFFYSLHGDIFNLLDCPFFHDLNCALTGLIFFIYCIVELPVECGVGWVDIGIRTTVRLGKVHFVAKVCKICLKTFLVPWSLPHRCTLLGPCSTGVHMGQKWFFHNIGFMGIKRCRILCRFQKYKLVLVTKCTQNE